MIKRSKLGKGTFAYFSAVDWNRSLFDDLIGIPGVAIGDDTHESLFCPIQAVVGANESHVAHIFSIKDNDGVSASSQRLPVLLARLFVLRPLRVPA